MTGQDVFIMQNLIVRSPFVNPIQIDGIYGHKTASAVGLFQAGNGLNVPPEVFENITANLLLELQSCDSYVDDGLSAGKLGPYKYKFHFQTFRDRHWETKGFLFDRDNNLLHQFVARLHGHSFAQNPSWPDYTQDEGLNMFSTNGNTPTGFFEVDLNSPEPNSTLYGPYPVNRFLNGMRGNAEFLNTPTGSVRSGILLHTGEWPGWTEGQPMPNSDGCLHAAPEDIQTIWQLLVNECGVEVRPNPYGEQPYPYQPQGVGSVEQVICQ
eukprot:CAMPEP_0201488958 /NCGR_PEP_ID=MMETSP0151_2-20130828/20759_1 /ASSEMBLY_ACC=CAM_ASM_000257 /TAXON_ID=200890 /ORGANISM="Paramoeba atlantica, Strain 621/1 / CCAP 1560/9" /LENGTH=266 /DNA_ID=CAMNT_0047874407 /DNA_START=214 /DNA_END=1014 /DNA_ORIENTATION=-